MNGAYLLDAGDSLLLFLGKVLQPFFCEKVRHCTSPLRGHIVELWLFRCLESANLWMLTRTWLTCLNWKMRTVTGAQDCELNLNRQSKVGTIVRLRGFVQHLNPFKPYPVNVTVVRDDSKSRYQSVKFFFNILRNITFFRNSFINHLVDDRSEASYSYYEFLQHLKTQIKWLVWKWNY